MKKPSKRSRLSKQIEQLQKLQTQYSFKLPLTFYQKCGNGRPEEQEQKAFCNCLFAEFGELLGEYELIKPGSHTPELIYPALIVATADFYDRTGRKMTIYRHMGYQPGTLDMTFLVPRGGYHGLIIEMKSLTGSATPGQRKTADYLCANGYSCHTCKGFAEALKVFLEYFELI